MYTLNLLSLSTLNTRATDEVWIFLLGFFFFIGITESIEEDYDPFLYPLQLHTSSSFQ